MRQMAKPTKVHWNAAEGELRCLTGSQAIDMQSDFTPEVIGKSDVKSVLSKARRSRQEDRDRVETGGWQVKGRKGLVEGGDLGVVYARQQAHRNPTAAPITKTAVAPWSGSLGLLCHTGESTCPG